MLKRFCSTLVLGALLLGTTPIVEGAGWREKNYNAWLAALPAEGPPPTREYVEEAVLAFLKYRLKDDSAARYEWGGIAQGNFRGAFERHGTSGWIADVSVNGKNSYGAYVGYVPYKFIFRSGYIVEVYTYDTRRKSWLPMIGTDGEFAPPLPSYAIGAPAQGVEASKVDCLSCESIKP